MSTTARSRSNTSLSWVFRRTVLFLLLCPYFFCAAALEITILNVGQGTSVLIQAPTGQTVLYDAGPRTGNAAATLRALGVEQLNLVIASHAHEDHIGGMGDVLSTYRPAFFMDNGIAHTTRTYERTLEAVHGAGSQLLGPEHRAISLGDVTLTIAPPPGTNTRDQNNNSIGLRIDYGSFSAFLSGDAEESQWNWWLHNHPDLFEPVTLHLSSHHGSRNGDTHAVIAALQPRVVAISLGSGNSYGHPHAEVLDLYQQAIVYRTDQHGHVQVRACPDGRFSLYSLTVQNPAVEVDSEQLVASGCNSSAADAPRDGS